VASLGSVECLGWEIMGHGKIIGQTMGGKWFQSLDKSEKKRWDFKSHPRSVHIEHTHIFLVGGLEHLLFFHILEIIIPTD
jgi:hypothetical protein